MAIEGIARPVAGRGDDAGGDPDPEIPPEPAMELLVHGVGGTTAGDMLADPRVTRVTGDDTADIHRRTEDLDERPWDDRTPLREAYCWCDLTSGDASRVLWLLLLPFMIVNLAHWMRPLSRGARRAHAVYDVLVRLLALSLTVLFVAGVCAVALDLVAWQCAGSATCAEGTSWIEPFGPGEGWWSQPGRRLALAALLPVALVVLLWWLSYRTWSAYESASPPPRPRSDAGEHAVLSLPGFWFGRGLVARLRATHTAAGLLTVATALLVATGEHDRGPDGGTGLMAVGWLLTALTVAGWGVVAVQQGRHSRTEEEPDERPQPPASRALPWGTLALLVLVLAHTVWDRPGWVAAGRLPAAAGVFPVLMVAQLVLIAGVALTAHRLHRQAPSGDRGTLYGLGGACVAVLACGLGEVLTGGVAQRAADWLDPAAAPGEPGAVIAGPPSVLSWAAAVIPPLLFVVLVLAAAALVHAGRVARRLSPTVVERYADEGCEPLRERSDGIATATARAGLTDAAPLLIGALTGTALVLGVVAAAGSATGDTPSRAADDAPAAVAAVANTCQALGSWLMGAGVLLLLALGRRAYRDTSARRTVGILWDIGTFWPRAAHPFAPPCYAERAVPDLSWRMGTWVEATGGRLVISAHSQGSVLAAAAVWQLDAATRSRIALLTHGSPLARLYGRWFPAYFGPQALVALHRDMPRWRNLWRATDPIGGPVGVAAADVPRVDRGPLPDPLHYGRTLRRPLPEPILGHSDYAADPAFAAERAKLFHRVVRGAPDLPAQPGAPGAERPGAGRPVC
ncbi:hypothetical protein [Streptomyces sp. NBC_01803]|uniref:hypothetical protein n=1 Tax=Streptomyces sp. NBC_01803 TaxID=2975946 RepID=UPI002DD80FAE|nr:hypothetical protein [Streptomyces sp. NBC_01803]WSA47222.1 hypothetical protein OIE51_25395 [Streptomyces sp. NBC_01803]